MTTDGKREWIEATVATYEHRLVVYAAHLLGDTERAHDVVQDTFLKLWKIERTSVEDHLVKWLYRVVRNAAIDVKRKESRMTPAGEAIESLGRPAVRSGRSEERPDETDVRQMARAVDLVGKLPPRQQEAVRLKFQAGLSYREIAEVMDTTVNNVGVLLHTALKGVRAKLTEMEETPTMGGAGATG